MTKAIYTLAVPKINPTKTMTIHRPVLKETDKNYICKLPIGGKIHVDKQKGYNTLEEAQATFHVRCQEVIDRAKEQVVLLEAALQSPHVVTNENTTHYGPGAIRGR